MKKLLWSDSDFKHIFINLSAYFKKNRIFVTKRVLQLIIALA